MRYSIFVPVHNGMPYIRDCVRSILRMENQDFELHVLDNASSDGTYEWLSSVQDKRLKISCSTVKLSIEESWLRIKKLRKKNEFMTILGHDDLVEPSFLDDANELIEQNPTAALYSIGVAFINHQGRFLRNANMLPTGVDTSAYLQERLQFKTDMFGSGFIFRSDAYDSVGGIPSFNRLLFADDVLWLKIMGDAGWLVTTNARSCKVRLHDKSASASNPAIWPDLLSGLGSFATYLDHLKKDSPKIKATLSQYLEPFMLRYHANAMIYAYMESIQTKQWDVPSKLQAIRESYHVCCLDSQNAFRRPLKLASIEVMYKLGLTQLIFFLWKTYWKIRRQ